MLLTRAFVRRERNVATAGTGAEELCYWRENERA